MAGWVVLDFEVKADRRIRRHVIYKGTSCAFVLVPIALPSGVQTVFSQIASVIYPSELDRCAKAFPTKRVPRNFSHYDHFLALCFAQLTFRHSLRDIVCSLLSRSDRLYQMGFRGTISRTNLAYANEHRDWQFFFAVAQVLMRRAGRLYQPESAGGEFANVAFALDSSIIALSLKLFPWGYYARSRRAALKLHLMLCLQGNVPVWGAVTEADFPDMKMLDHIPLQPGAWYIMDRGYLDFGRLWRIHHGGAWFVVRSKAHVRYVVLQIISPPKITRAIVIVSDQIVQLQTPWSKRSYPEPLRKVVVFVPKEKRTLEILTNNLNVDALDIAQFYKSRWQVELFFKWIKQHLRIRSFFGRSQNAVRCQIWSAICAYLMVAIARKTLNIEKSLYELLQIISVNPFENQGLYELSQNKPTQQISSDFQNSFVFNEN
jgi:hypothetical protein